MKAFVCLAISCLLIGLLYVYVRQQFAAQNNTIGELSRFIRGMAAEVTEKEIKVVQEDEKEDKQVLIEVSDDSESDSDSESESGDEGADIRTFDIESVKVEMPELLEPEVLPEIIEVVVEETAKKIVLETNYEQWSLKELKEKISGMGGPNLKTKKLMIEYLEKKV
jgi:hypothetical protein